MLSHLFTFRNFLNVKRLEELVPLGVGRVLLTTESDTGLGAVDVAVLNLSHSLFLFIQSTLVYTYMLNLSSQSGSQTLW